MAWLSGITDKATQILNKIDENAAIALKKDKTKTSKTGDHLTEIMTSDETGLRDFYSATNKQNHIENQSPALSLSSSSVFGQHSSSLKSSPNHAPSNSNMVKSSSSNRLQKLEDSDEQLIQFLNNTSSTVPALISNNEVTIKENNINFNTKEMINSISSDNLAMSDDCSSNKLTTKDGIESKQHHKQQEQHLDDLSKENQMLRNEVRTVNNEMSLLLHRTKAAEKESEKMNQEVLESQSIISRLQADLQGVRLQIASDDERLRSLESENDRLKNSLSAHTESTNNANIEMSTVIEELKQRVLDSQLRENSITAELSSLRDRLRITDEEKIRIDNIKKDLENQNKVISQRLSDLKTEFEQYKTRAQRTLSNKEELITELRKSSSESNGENILELELQQLREEKASFSEECLQMANRLEIVRGELANAELDLEKTKEEAAAAQHTLQESLIQEQRRREVAEEDCRAQNEELRSIREELSRQSMLLNSRLKERDSELKRLRSQLTQRPASPPQVPDEIENRLTALTSSLVQKQTYVEALAREKNALRLQLEQTEYKYREAVKLLNQIQGRMINVNDTDDAKAQVPSFLIESPFDTGVTRRVKRAYSSLDAVGIRTSVFLRRYPLARISIMFYVVLLHLWVFLVLFSYTPDSSANVKL